MFACSNCMITQLVTLRGNKMELQIGLSSEKEMIVTESDLASVSGNIGAEVLSTHCLVLLMELAARQVVEGRIPKSKITLGTHVDIRHFSAALVGSKVRAVARLIDIEHNRLHFHVAAYDDYEKLAEGENEQVIVSRNLFLKKIRRKTHSKQQSDQ